MKTRIARDVAIARRPTGEPPRRRACPHRPPSTARPARRRPRARSDPAASRRAGTCDISTATDLRANSLDYAGVLGECWTRFLSLRQGPRLDLFGPGTIELEKSTMINAMNLVRAGHLTSSTLTAAEDRRQHANADAMGIASDAGKPGQTAADVRLAEGVGFEPTREREPPGGFQDRCLKPLGHPSNCNVFNNLFLPIEVGTPVAPMSLPGAPRPLL